MKFNRNYLIRTIVILITEILIALYIKDIFIRPFVGDVLVVLLMNFVLFSIIYKKHNIIILSTLIFAILIEISQYYHIAQQLGIKNKIALVIIGSTFDRKDMLAYFIGATITYFITKQHHEKN